MLYSYVFFIYIFLCANATPAHSDSELDTIISSLESGLEKLESERIKSERDLIIKHYALRKLITDIELDIEDRFKSLVELNDIELSLDKLKLEYELNRVCYRFRKGIEVMKMIYEKVLSLDHHFSSLVSYQDISLMSNPNSYPEFVKLKDEIKNNTKAKNKVQVPQLLDSNPIFSMGYTMIYSFFGTESKAKRVTKLKEVSCLLDFSLSMYSDLKIIFHETNYLKVQNDDLKKSSHNLFDLYTKMLDYKYGLKYCRTQDDWDQLIESLESIRVQLLSDIKISGSIDMPYESTELSQLKFNIDLLMDFIDSYNHFIYLGGMYYQKFLSIVENYENADKCTGSLPRQFESLSDEIVLSINKFESAYKLAELKGSKLRELMYGVPQKVE